MTWAKIASAGLPKNGPPGSSSHALKWHCPIDEKNQTLIEQYSLSMAQKHQVRSIAIRAGVHNTLAKKDSNGKRYIEDHTPWHFTVEFETQHGRFRNAHVYTQMQARRDARTGNVEMVATGIAKVGAGGVRVNPEVFDEQEFPSRRRQATSRSIVNFSMSTFMFRL